MKRLGKLSLPSFLALALNLLWWLELVAAVACAFIVFITGHYRNALALQVPLTYSPISIRQFYPRQPENVSILNSTNGMLSIHVVASWQVILMLFVGYGALFAVILLITFQLKRILQTIGRGAPFNTLNLRRIRTIAFVLMGYSVVQWVVVVVKNQILLSAYNFRHLELTYDFNFSCLVTGIVLLAVEGIFRTGLALEEDKKLTI